MVWPFSQTIPSELWTAKERQQTNTRKQWPRIAPGLVGRHTGFQAHGCLCCRITTIFPSFTLDSLKKDDKKKAAGAPKYKIYIKCSVSEMKRLTSLRTMANLKKKKVSSSCWSCSCHSLLPAACTSSACWKWGAGGAGMCLQGMPLNRKYNADINF